MNKRWLEALKPKEVISVSDWAAQHRTIALGTSRAPGIWNNSLTPYLVDVMNSYNDEEVRHTVLCFGTQLGKTETIINVLLYAIAHDLYNAMFIEPREDDAKQIVRTRIHPAIMGCKPVIPLMAENIDLQQLLEMHFAGMVLYVSGANSPATLAQKPVRLLLRDEIDKYPQLFQTDADPLSLSEERCKSFWDIRKVFDVSSPTLPDIGIWNQILGCDTVYEYYVPCVHCGTYIIFQFKQIKYDKSENPLQYNKKAEYICQSCYNIINDHDKIRMLANGKWMPAEWHNSNSGRTRIGYHLSSLYSPWLTWSDIVSQWIDANYSYRKRNDIGKLRNFLNGWLAEPFVDTEIITTDAVEIHISDNVEFNIVPEDTVALTAGIDVQSNRFYYTIYAFTSNGDSYLISYGVCQSFADLENEIINKEYRTKSGVPYRVWRCGIDSGGNYLVGTTMTATQAVYRWVASNRFKGVQIYPTKGSSKHLSGATVQIQQIKETTKDGHRRPTGLQLVIIDTNFVKDILALKMENGKKQLESGLYFPKVSPEFIGHMTAEVRTIDKYGRPCWKPRQTKADNHWWDCTVIAHAMVTDDLYGGLRALRQDYNKLTIKLPMKKNEKKYLTKHKRW